MSTAPATRESTGAGPADLASPRHLTSRPTRTLALTCSRARFVGYTWVAGAVSGLRHGTVARMATNTSYPTLGDAYFRDLATEGRAARTLIAYRADLDDTAETLAITAGLLPAPAVLDALVLPVRTLARSVHGLAPAALVEVGVVERAAARRGEDEVGWRIVGGDPAQYVDHRGRAGDPSLARPRLRLSEVSPPTAAGVVAAAVVLPRTAYADTRNGVADSGVAVAYPTPFHPAGKPFGGPRPRRPVRSSAPPSGRRGSSRTVRRHRRCRRGASGSRTSCRRRRGVGCGWMPWCCPRVDKMWTRRSRSGRSPALVQVGHAEGLERVTGIEPALQAWEARVLPLNYTRVSCGDDATSERGGGRTR